MAVFDTASYTPLARLPTGAQRLRRLAFLTDSHTLLATTADGRLLKWQDVAVPDGVVQSRRLGACSGALAVDEERGFVAAGGANGQLALWPLDWTVRVTREK